MPNRLLIAYHLCWTGYGHWLPNEPRGSGSKTVRCDWIAQLGELHFGRKRIQPPGLVVQAFHEEAEQVLRHAVLEFGPAEINLIAKSFGEVIAKQNYTCYACAIMPDHVHLVIRKHRDLGEEMIDYFQDHSRAVLKEAGFGAAYHPIWTEGGWKVYLFHPDEIRTRIRYIEQNPGKDGLPAQKWGFVKEYDGWPLHPGHSPNSPWARRLRGEQ